MESLPVDILHLILELVFPDLGRDLIDYRLVSKTWYRLVSRLPINFPPINQLHTSSSRIKKLAVHFPQINSLALAPMIQFDFDALRLLPKLRDLTLRLGNTASLQLPSYLTSLKIVIYNKPLPIPHSTFSSLANSLLSFTYQSLEFSDVPLIHFPKLRSLNIDSNNAVSTPRLLNVLSQLSTLTQLDVRAKHLHVSHFSALTNLLSVNIVSRWDRSWLPSLCALRNLTSLRLLITSRDDCSSDDLLQMASSLPNLKEVPRLQERIALAGVLSAFTSLTSLTVPRNDARRVISQLSSLSRLRSISLRSGKLEKRPLLESLCFSANTLETLHTSHQDINESLIPSFKRLSKLSVIGISQETLDRFCRELCPTLRELHVSHSAYLSSLKELERCRYLNVLDVSYCGLKGSELQHLTSLQHLSVLHALGQSVDYSSLRNAQFRYGLDTFSWYMLEGRKYSNQEIEVISSFHKRCSVSSPNQELGYNLSLEQYYSIFSRVRYRFLPLLFPDMQVIETLLKATREMKTTSRLRRLRLQLTVIPPFSCDRIFEDLVRTLRLRYFAVSGDFSGAETARLTAQKLRDTIGASECEIRFDDWNSPCGEPFYVDPFMNLTETNI